MPNREGPNVTIAMSCHGCRHEHSESYRVQGDSGHDVYCTHPSAVAGLHAQVPPHHAATLIKRTIGDTTWRTPDWCPLRKRALAELAATLQVPA
jgi:hypothetical protein